MSSNCCHYVSPVWEKKKKKVDFLFYTEEPWCFKAKGPPEISKYSDNFSNLISTNYNH